MTEPPSRIRLRIPPLPASHGGRIDAFPEPDGTVVLAVEYRPGASFGVVLSREAALAGARQLARAARR